MRAPTPRPLIRSLGSALAAVSMAGLVACSAPSGEPSEAPSGEPLGTEAIASGDPLRSETEAARPAACTHCNVVLVLADTLRADRLGTYGHHRDTSPTLDALAARGMLFEQARSQASCTTPSVNSLLTSRTPQLFLGTEDWPGIPAEFPTLAEILRDAGWSTAAVSASPIVRATPSKMNRKGGFGSGFDRFDESCEWMPSRCVTQRAIEQIDTLEEPFFLYAHYMDPHDPYVAQAPNLDTWSKEVEQPSDEVVLGGSSNGFVESMRRDRRVEVDPVVTEFLLARYDEEIRTFDDGLAVLLETLEARGLMERTIFVIASDHGEAFGEHDTIKHCYTTFDTEIRVPLAFIGPGISAGRRAHGVGNLDIVPTTLELLGVPSLPTHEGRSLGALLGPDRVAPLEGEPGDQRAVLSYQGAWRSVTDGRFKLLRNLKQDGPPRLFDVQADPEELRDLALEHRREVARLRRWLREAAGKDSENTDQRLRQAEEAEEQLRSLGYLG